jgi:benzoyl-CoA reductase subunit C
MSANTDPCAPLLARAEALLEDLHLGTVSAWKAANPGSLAIGIMPVFAPRPLFEAIGVLPVNIYGGGDRVDVIKGDAYYQSYICHIPRSTIEMGLGGHLDALDGMVFPSTCDVIRNLSGMWRMLFPQKYSSYLDLPQTFEAPLGGLFYRHELNRIAAELAERGAKPLTEDNLRVAIANENERRGLLADLAALRAKEPWRVKASEAYLLTRAGAVLPCVEHTAMLRDFLAQAHVRPTRPYDNVRVIVLGAFCEQPPLGLIRTLERSGCDLIDDDFQLGLTTIEGNIPLDEDLGDTSPLDARSPLDAVVLSYTMRGQATATRYIAEQVKGKALVDRVRSLNAEGVILAAPSFCDPALLDQPMIEQALADAQIPFTSFKYAENSAQFQTIREQAGAFSDSVKLWGAA